MTTPVMQVPCTCTRGCAEASPCEADSTQEDLLCDPCRAAKVLEDRENYYHCHECGDQVSAVNELEAVVLVQKLMAAARGEQC
jgi:hypothetical protein